MLDELETCGKRKTDRIIWETALYYYGSILMNKYNFRKSIGSKPLIRYYTIVFSPSGTGKSYILNTVEKMCNLEKYSDAMRSFYDHAVGMLPVQPDDYSEVLRYMPKSVTIGVEGTAEGLFYVAKSQRTSNFGSLNLSTEEFGETIASSSGLLSKLKELYDGKFKAKIVKGDSDSEMREDINHIICNFIGMGSRKGVTYVAEKELKRIASSGMYRRTFIIDSDKVVEKNKLQTSTEKIEEYLDALNENFKADFIQRRKLDMLSEKIMTYTDEYAERLEDIDDDLILRANEDKLNEFAQYNTGSLEMVIDLSHIIAFLEWDTKVTRDHLNRAYDFMVRTRDSVEDTFKSVHPYKTMYNLLKLKDNMTISEMAEIEANIPITKTKVADNIALLEELCYREDKVLVKNEGKVTRYRIEDLPKTSLDKLIISIGMDNKGKMSTHFEPHTIGWETLKKLVVSSKKDSFTTAHFEDSYRKKDNFIQGQNLIALDIDSELSLERAKEIFKPYTYLIYTTKSHRKEKGEQGIEDRFRIVIPTKTTYYVTEDQHKRLYENLADALDVHNDTQTKNVSRLWFTNPEAEIFENHAELMDITPYIPDTIKSDKIMPVITDINTQVEEGELGRREAGFIKWFLINTSDGNRHDHLTKAAYFFKDLGLPWKDRVTRLNNMLNNPMSDADMRFIYSIK